MKKNKKRTIQKISPTENHTAIFKRKLHSAKVLRFGTGEARKIVPPSSFPNIVRQLGTQPVYKALFAPVTFPKSLKDYPTRRRLISIAPHGEILWSASVLALFSVELEKFVNLKNKFYNGFLNNNYDEANEALEEIRSDLGYSLWYIGKKIHLLQKSSGLKAQKDFLEEIMSTESSNQLITWVSYYLSLQAESGVSFSDFRDEINAIDGGIELKDYITTKLIPTELPTIENPSSPVSWDEPHCVIDRFETLISMISLYISRRGKHTEKEIFQALSELEKTGDTRITRILNITRGKHEKSSNELLHWADLYTLGDYKKVINGECEVLELKARAHACIDTSAEEYKPSSIKETIIKLMYKSLMFDTGKSQAEQLLKKIALQCSGHQYADQIGAFLHRKHDFILTNAYTELQNINALTGPNDNPWSAPILDQLVPHDWHSILKSTHPLSPALILRDVLKYGDTFKAHHAISLPTYRLFSYNGHSAMMEKKYPAAVINYKNMMASNIRYISNSAKIYLYDAYMAMADYRSAMYLVVDHCIETPSAGRAYPLEKLIATCLNEQELQEDIGLAILIFISTKNGVSKFERDLSDVYENVLGGLNLTRPTELIPFINKENKNRYIYFLKHVCVPRTLDDTTLFETVEEIDAERISICQELLQLDTSNEQAYLNEIRLITRDTNVAKLLEKVQSSKIFVDEDGIKQVLEPSLASSFNRYLQLLNSPSLAYQAEKLSKLLVELLNNTGHSEIKHLKLPATELETLFRSMLLDCMHQFAFNPAYGLDTHVSTTIRHGSFEGHLRSPLAIEDLLCTKIGDQYILPENWKSKFKDWEDHDLIIVTKALSKFTQSFDEIISLYLKEKLHVKTSDLPQGMFSFDSSSRSSNHLMHSITTSTEFNNLYDKLMNYCWELTELSLKAIREDLKNSLSAQVSQLFETLIKSIEARIPHIKLAPLIDSIARSRTAIQLSITDISEWFKRPNNLTREPFELELAIHVAMQQIKNCYVKTPIAPSLTVDVPFKIDGSMLDGLCEIFFILLQNVIIHGGVQNQTVPVTLKVRSNGKSILIECTNQLSSMVSIEERRAVSNNAMSVYEHDSALRRARKEGGSGLSKVWRIAEFDLRATHELMLTVDDIGTFTAKLTLTQR